MNQDIHTCSICHKDYFGFGNNAEPINKGRCCDECNANVVVPTRMARIYAARIVTQGSNDNGQ